MEFRLKITEGFTGIINHYEDFSREMQNDLIDELVRIKNNEKHLDTLSDAQLVDHVNDFVDVDEDGFSNISDVEVLHLIEYSYKRGVNTFDLENLFMDMALYFNGERS